MTTNSKAIMAIALLAALSVFVAFATIPAITPAIDLDHGHKRHMLRHIREIAALHQTAICLSTIASADPMIQ